MRRHAPVNARIHELPLPAHGRVSARTGPVWAADIA